MSVVEQATQYMHLMTQLTPPDAFYFRSYASEGVSGLGDLCAAAASLATGEEATAVASLVVAPGETDTFCIHGTHARATLSLCPTPHTRLYVIAATIVALLILFVCWRR